MGSCYTAWRPSCYPQQRKREEKETATTLEAGRHVTRIRATLRSFAADMDYYQSAGCQSELPEELLHILGSDCLKSATKWTLTQTRRYFLNIVVSRTKPFKFPAKNENRPRGSGTNVGNAGTGFIPPSTIKGPGLRLSEQESEGRTEDCQSGTDRTSIHPDLDSNTRTEKRRSPSTRKRNRERWERWQERSRKKGASNLFRTEPVSRNTCSGNTVPRHSSKPVPVPHQDPESSTSQSEDEHNLSSHSDSDAEGANLLEPSAVTQPILITHCYNCQKPKLACPDGLKKCTRCFKAFYCGRACQGLDWHRHRLICTPPVKSANSKEFLK